MRLRSGTTDQYIYFVAFADTGTSPGSDRMPGYAAKFTVRRSRDGGASAAYTTPTINETDSTNMPGVYELLLDEDTTLAAGNETEAYVVHINDTGGHVRPTTREIELYRSDTGAIADAVWQAQRSGFDTDTGSMGYSIGNVTEIRGDTGGAAHLLRLADEHDTGRLQAEATATLDTGAINQSVWQGDATRILTAFAFDTGVSDTVWKAQRSGYDADTGSMGYSIGNVMEVRGDTGGAIHLLQMANEYDTGRLPAEAAATLDTGAVNQSVWQGDATRVLTANTNLAGLTVDVTQLDSDTGQADRLGKFASLLTDNGQVDTGTGLADTGAHATAVWAKDTRVLTASTNLSGLTVDVTQLDGDTGQADRLGKFASLLTATGQIDTGTGLADTGAHATAVWALSARTLTAFAHDTGVSDTVWKAQRSGYDSDTGSMGYAIGNVTEVRGDTGAAQHLLQMANEYDTGRLPADATATTDTGAVNNAVWNGVRSDHTTAGSFGESVVIADTGSTDAIASRLLEKPNAVETDLKVVEALRMISSMLGGTVSGAGTGTETFKNAVADSKSRVVATVDSSGNRTAMTLTLDT